MPRRRGPNASANAAKSREEAQVRASYMERSARTQLAELHHCLVTRASHERCLSAKYVVDRHLNDLVRWLEIRSQRKACGAEFVRDLRGRIADIRREAQALQERSRRRPSERRRRRRERRQHQAEQELLDMRIRAEEELERARQAVAELEAREPGPVDSSSSEAMDE